MIQEKPSSSWEMKNYQLYLVQRNWKRFKRQCFFLVQRWKTYQLFKNSCNRCRIRMGILDKNSSRSFYMKDCSQAVILFSVTKTLSWQRNKSMYIMNFFARRYNDDIWKIVSQTINTPMTWQEDHSRESFRKIVREDHFRL